MYREWKKTEFPKEYYIWIWEQQHWEVDQEIDGKMGWERMEEAPENGKESLNSAHANGINVWMFYFVDSFLIIFEFLLLFNPIIIVIINWYFYLLELSYDVTYCVFLSPPGNIYLLSVSILFCISSSLNLDVGLHNGRLFPVFIFKSWLQSSYCPTGCILCFCL